MTNSWKVPEEFREKKVLKSDKGNSKKAQVLGVFYFGRIYDEIIGIGLLPGRPTMIGAVIEEVPMKRGRHADFYWIRR